MAISMRPLTDSFSLVWQHDPAIDREKFATDEEFAKAYSTAVDTLDFAPLLKAGESPTWFKFKPIAASRMAELSESRPELDEGRLTAKGASLAFRMALASEPLDLKIDGMPKWSRSTDPQYPTFGALVSLAWCDFLDACASEMGQAPMTQSLGALAIIRSMPRPKS